MSKQSLQAAIDKKAKDHAEDVYSSHSRTLGNYHYGHSDKMGPLKARLQYVADNNNHSRGNAARLLLGAPLGEVLTVLYDALATVERDIAFDEKQKEITKELLDMHARLEELEYE